MAVDLITGIIASLVATLLIGSTVYKLAVDKRNKNKGIIQKNSSNQIALQKSNSNTINIGDGVSNDEKRDKTK